MLNMYSLRFCACNVLISFACHVQKHCYTYLNMYCNIKVVHDFVLSMLCLYDFILEVTINNFFSHVKMGLPGVESVLSRDICVLLKDIMQCSR